MRPSHPPAPPTLMQKEFQAVSKDTENAPQELKTITHKSVQELTIFQSSLWGSSARGMLGIECGKKS